MKYLRVVELAKDAANQFGWQDPITKVEAADIKSFEGALFANDDKSAWCLLYNNAMKSPGEFVLPKRMNLSTTRYR